MSEENQGGGRSEWTAGWPTVLVSSLGISLSTAHIYSQGLFMAPLQKAFGWNRAEITSGPFLLSIVGGLGILFSGMMVDRFGARRMVIPGLLLYALAIATLMLTTGSIWQWYGSWLLIGLTVPLTTPGVWTSAIVARFSISRGLALAVALAGTGLSSAVAPQIIVRVIAAYGWRTGYAFYPLFTALVIFPLTVMIFDRSPRPAPAQVAAIHAIYSQQPVGQTMRSPAFLWILTASFTFAFGLMAIMAHFVPMVTEKGLARTTAAAAVGVVGLCSITGRLTTGFLLDRFNTTLVAAVAFLLPILPVSALILFKGQPLMAFGTAMVLGLSLGAEVDIIAYLTAHHFGIRRYGTFLGLSQGISAVAVGGGPLVGGLIYDATGNYSLLLWGCIPLFVIGAMAIVMLGRLPVRTVHLAPVLDTDVLVPPEVVATVH